MLATTARWATIKTNRNKLKETQRELDSEEVRLRKQREMQQTDAWTLSDGGS
jgi:hypothetical protein